MMVNMGVADLSQVFTGHLHYSDLSFQKKYFKANCMIRGSRAPVTWPKLPLLRFTVSLLISIRKLLVRLNASARNSIFCRSRNWKLLERATSNCHVPGPATLLDPALPRAPVAGSANAAALR